MFRDISLTHLRLEDNSMMAAVSRSSSDSLHKLEDVRLINKRPCDDLYHRHLSRIKVRSGSFCGLSQAGDSCKGDSGSGLVYFNPRTRWYCIAMSIGGECINILIFLGIGNLPELSATEQAATPP